MTTPIKIYHANLIRADLMRMDFSAKRLLYIALSKIERQYKVNDVVLKFDREEEFTITVKEYSKLCNISEKEGYRQMKLGAKALIKTVFDVADEVYYAHCDNQKVVLNKAGTGRLFPIVSRARYNANERTITIKLSEDMEPFVSQLSDNFTGQILLSALRLPDSGAGKLYLLLREWISLGYKNYRVISVEELKEKLSVLGKYEEYKHFKSKLLDKAIRALIANTEFEDVQVEIIERRQKFAHMLKITYRATSKKVTEVKGERIS